MKMTRLAAAFAVCCLAASVTAGLNGVSSGDVVLGEWNSDFDACKAYAEANHTPMVLFWASAACGQCANLEKACNTPEFADWRTSRQFVMCFVQNNVTVKDWARNSSGKFPYCVAYWSKADGTVINDKFTGRPSFIKGAGGSTLAQMFANRLDQAFATSGQPVSPTDDPGNVNPAGPSGNVGNEWKVARALKGGLFSADGRCLGMVLVKTGRANFTTKRARVSAKVTLADGKNRTFSPIVVGVDTTTVAGMSKTRVGSMTVSITGADLGGTFTDANGVVYTIAPATLGGATADGTYAFTLDQDPATIKGLPVLGQFLPKGVEFTSRRSRWIFGSRGSVRYNAAQGGFVASSTANAASVKLSYRKATGFFRGNFKVYTQQTATRVRAASVTVTGWMLGTNGAGVVTVKGEGSYNCSISAK